MQTEKLYYIETLSGCQLRAACSLQQAREEAIRAIGTDNFIKCTEATKTQIEWVRAMGGYMPELRKV